MSRVKHDIKALAHSFNYPRYFWCAGLLIKTPKPTS